MVNFSIGQKVKDFKEVVRTDTTTNRVKNILVKETPRLPGATARYLVEKVPIVQWLPRYDPSWLLTDFISGLTIGVMLIPQGLAYAKLAEIPIENGLYSSWLPAAICVFMGTSKDLSSGPTSILGLLTAEIIHTLLDDGYTAAEIANAVAFWVGIMSLAMGVLGLGFLLDFVSVPVLTGFISATALIIGMGQVGALVGLKGVPTGVFNQIGDILKRLPQWDGPTCAIGIGSILVLVALEQIGKRYGKKHFIIKYLASSRAIVVLVIFTLISYLVNKDRKKNLLWDISKVNTHGIQVPKAHDAGLLGKVATKAIAPLIACTLEHLAVGKAFGRKNGYEIDESQEFNYLGVTNIVNSFFGAMPVGGAMSRTAVNSECGVRSPLSGLITAAFILLTIYVFSPALYWLPKATLSAIIIMAVIHLFGPISLFYRYWRISLADFVASMVCFWVTIFVSAEIGIGVGAGWSVAWTLLRSAFVKPVLQSHVDVSDSFEALTTRPRMDSMGGRHAENSSLIVPDDTVVIKFTDSVFFPNASRGKKASAAAIKLVYDKISSHTFDHRERSWSVAAERRLERLRKAGNVVLKESPLSVVVLDFSAVSFVDVTAVFSFQEMEHDVRSHCGEVQFRIVGLSASVRERLVRANWKLADLYGDDEDSAGHVVYPSVKKAIWHRDDILLDGVTIDDEKKG